MTSALAFFDAACAAGDDTVLELRAYALAGVARYVEAAETLDAFLSAHPLAGLPPDIQARVGAQEPEILARVASLSVDSDPPGAQVSVNHRAIGTAPVIHLRLEPGRYDISADAGEGHTQDRTVDLPAGESHQSFQFGPPKPGPEAAAAPAPSEAAHSSLHPWAIGTTTAAGAFLLVGIGGAIWSNERSSVYNTANCDGSDRTGCNTTLSQFHTGRDLEIAGFVVGGLAAVAGGTLFYMDAQRGAQHAPPTSLGSLSCGLGLKSAQCKLTF
jgi:hypothetical protein